MTGTSTIIRRAEEDDAIGLREIMNHLSLSDENLLYEPGEVPTINCLKSTITKSRTDCIFVAYLDELPVGYAGLRRSNLRRVHHIGQIALGVVSEHRRQGIGTNLVKSLIRHANNTALTRLELRVSTDNFAAIALYERVGFVVEGTARNAAVVKDRQINKFHMTLLLK